MDKERLFGAAMKGAVQAKTTTNNDSAINTQHVINKIARVYMATFSEFKGLTPLEVADKCQQLFTRDDIQKLYTLKGFVNNGDAVIVMEALRWTGILATTERIARFKLALVEPNKNVPHKDADSMEKTSIWNSMVLDDFDEDEYSFNGAMVGVLGYNIKVLNVSNDVYDVKLN